MREHLDTMPVWEAFRQDSECPMCLIREKNELDFVDSCLGGSVMEPSRRVEVNAKGFCQRHFSMLFAVDNRLGLALMTDTHMREVISRFAQAMERATASAKERAAKPLPARLIGKKGALETAADEVAALSHGCVLCERLDAAMERYARTAAYMWKHEAEFRARFAETKGLCIPHCADLLRAAPAEMSAKELEAFTDALSKLMTDNLRRVEKELEWFTLKHDYRNRDADWGESRDSVERAINKLRGKTVGS